MGCRPIVALLIALKFSQGLDENLFNHNVNATTLVRPFNFAGNDLLYLSELPLEQLLKVKKSLGELRRTSEPAYLGDNESSGDALESRMIGSGNFFQPQLQSSALTLNEDQKINKKYDSLDPWDSKPSKVQTFFQISITALAFLAFAAYLLCMIVQAIKSKGSMYVYPNSMGSMTNSANTMNSLINTGSVPLRKRRPVGRRRRNVFLSPDNQNATDAIEDAIALPDPSEMYRVMIQCAESYSKLYFIQ